MYSLNDTALECNRQFKINFNGGDLSSDAGLLLIKEFACRMGFVKILKSMFKTNDSALLRFHKNDENLCQEIYQILGGYFEDDCADELTNDPIFTAVLDKKALASQPAISRFMNRLDEDTLNQFYDLMRRFRRVVYSIKRPEMLLLDLDSTLLDTYGRQEGEGFNAHYRNHGYHPLAAYDGITGDLLKIQLRNGTVYSSTGVVGFLQPLLDEFSEDYPNIPLLLRADSGFTKPELYEQCETNGVSYVIRLKENGILRGLAASIEEELVEKTRDDKVSYAVCYGEFLYQAYMEAWRTIPPHEPRMYLFAFLARIARHISLNICRDRNRLKRSAFICELSTEMEQCIPSPNDTECLIDDMVLKDAINNFIATLDVEKRNIFLRRYWFLDSIASISKRYALSESKVKTILFRCRNQLREYLEKEGYTI